MYTIGRTLRACILTEWIESASWGRKRGYPVAKTMHQLGSIALIDICNRSAVPLFLARTTCARTRGPSVGSESPSSAGGRMGGGSGGMAAGQEPLSIPREPPPILPPADDGDSDPTDGPRVLAQVVLAKKRGTADLLHMSISAIDPNWCIVL